MRALALLVCVAGCGSAPPTPGATTLRLDAEFAALTTPPAGVSIATAALHLVGVTAVSDRSSADPRARLAELDFAMAGAASATLPSVPPGLYSGLRFTLGDPVQAGLDMMGAFRTTRLHVILSNAPVFVSCADPLPLDPGGGVTLMLHVDPARAFDGVDLAAGTPDSDDNGLLISADDNPALAARMAENLVKSFQLDCQSL